MPEQRTSWYRDLPRAEYLMALGHHREAGALALEWLEQDPTDLLAHYLLLGVWWWYGERDMALLHYRQLHESHPDNDTHRLAYALALDMQPGRGTHDDEIRRLLLPLPEDPQHRFVALLRLHGLHMRCEDEGSPGSFEEMRELAGAHPQLDLLAPLNTPAFTSSDMINGLMLQLRPRSVGDGTCAHIAQMLDEEPLTLGRLSMLVQIPEPDSALAALQEHVLARAEENLASDDPLLIYQVYELFIGARIDSQCQRVLERLAQLEPHFEKRLDDSYKREIALLPDRLEPEVALADLEALKPRMAHSRRTRSRYERERAERLVKLHRDDEAHEVLLALVQADPDDRAAADSLCESAMKGGRDLELALRLTEEAIEITVAEEFGSSQCEYESSLARGYALWQNLHRLELANRWFRQGRILERLGRDEEAARAHRHVLSQQEPSPAGGRGRLYHSLNAHLRLGRILKRKGQNESAFEHLARAAVQHRICLPHDELPQDLFDDLEPLYESRPYGFPGGLEQFLAYRREAFEEQWGKTP